jgi:hypothetical protein
LKTVSALLFRVFISVHLYSAKKGGEIDGEEESREEAGEEGRSEEESSEEEKINVSR